VHALNKRSLAGFQPSEIYLFMKTKHGCQVHAKCYPCLVLKTCHPSIPTPTNPPSQLTADNECARVMLLEAWAGVTEYRGVRAGRAPCCVEAVRLCCSRIGFLLVPCSHARPVCRVTHSCDVSTCFCYMRNLAASAHCSVKRDFVLRPNHARHPRQLYFLVLGTCELILVVRQQFFGPACFPRAAQARKHAYTCSTF
jgi:hypothetical protein